MQPVEIDAPDDVRLDPFRNLKGQASRPDGTFVAESELVLARLIESSIVVPSILVTHARAERLGRLLSGCIDAQHQRGLATTVYVATRETIDAVVGYPLHRGVIALAVRPPLPNAVDLLATARTVVVMEGVMDPENIGSTFRHAAGFGVDAVVLHGRTGDPLYRKAIRIAMGWSLTIPFARTLPGSDVNTLLANAGFETLALTPSPQAAPLTETVSRLSSSARIALLVGAEGPGLEESTIAGARHRVRIPLAAGVDSLNVATALAIALHTLTTAHPGRLARSNQSAGHQSVGR